jgi:hypothetical protein
VSREHKRPELDEPGRTGAIEPQAQAQLGGGNARDLVQTLQQRAGNAAVTALIAGAPAGVQRAPKLGAGDELMSPDGEVVAPRATNGKGARESGASKAGSGRTDGEAGGTFEADLFDRSILNPLRAAYACVRDSPPDHELALQHLQRVGEALWDYEQRYRGRDEGLANGFYAARGWLGRVARELGARLGNGKPMSDETIALFVSDTLADLNGLQNRLQ